MLVYIENENPDTFQEFLQQHSTTSPPFRQSGRYRGEGEKRRGRRGEGSGRGSPQTPRKRCANIFLCARISLGVVGVTKEKSQRLRDLLETIYAAPKGISYPALRAAAIRQWVIGSRTADEYLEILINSGMAVHDPPGGPLHITPAGERWLDAGTVEPPADEVAIAKARTPSPPSPTIEGGQG